jgi:hypothetical protein
MKWLKKKSGYRSKCCWCGKKISKFSPVYGLNAKFRKDVETPPVENEGYVIDLYVHESMDSPEYKPVWTIITAKNSDAKKAGYDMIFMLCSEECGHELKEILQAEIDFIDRVKGEGF